MADDAPAKVQLTLISIAYALLFYYAFFVLALGLAQRLWKYVRNRPSVTVSTDNPEEGGVERALRLVTEVVFIRSTFFRDRVAWIFGACFHFGLLLVLLRHLRYALEPAWLGPFWPLIVIAQPFGLYGGFVMLFGVLGFWGRRMLVPQLRQESRVSDYMLLMLLTAIPLVGYFNAWVHTDIIAVKTFFIGLATFDWQPLPNDPLLLTHMWLVALLMVALPFSRLLHLPGVFQPQAQQPRKSFLDKKDFRLLAIGVLGLALLAPAGVASFSLVKDGWTHEQPDFSKLARVHKAQDPTVMIRNHPNLLISHRSVVVYKGVRTATDSIEQCVTCHVVKGEDKQPIGIEDPKHFCRGCHLRAAVTIDCFECHNSKPQPVENKATSLDDPRRLASLFHDPVADQRSLAR